MKQITLDLDPHCKEICKCEFLEQMKLVFPSDALVEHAAPNFFASSTGPPPYALGTMLCSHFMQQLLTLVHATLEKDFFVVPPHLEFAQFQKYERLSDVSSLLSFRHQIAKHSFIGEILATVNALLSQRGLRVKAGTMVNVTSIAAPTSTKNRTNRVTLRCTPARSATSGTLA